VRRRAWPGQARRDSLRADPGFAAPVEQFVPVLTPYLELEDGRVLVSGDLADEITASTDGSHLRAVWK
jgi:hypothetical protein